MAFHWRSRRCRRDPLVAGFQSIFVDGGPSSHAGFFVTVYLAGEHSVTKLSVNQQRSTGHRANVSALQGFQPGRNNLQAIEAQPEFNMSGLAWVEQSSAIIVMAEIPCSSSYGGVMCAVQRYQLKVPTGTIEKRMTARQLKAQWQQTMAWDMRIPDHRAMGQHNPVSSRCTFARSDLAHLNSHCGREVAISKSSFFHKT